jgi:hypothetical protein
MMMATTTDGITPREQLVQSYDKWAAAQTELIATIRPALEAMDYDTAALALEAMAQSSARIGVRVRAEVERRKAKGW